MSCRFCGTALPEGAVFCGECGRTVTAAPATQRPVLPEIVFSSEPGPEPVARQVAVADSEYTCPQCGAAIDDDDVFCGECGFVLTSSYLSAPSDSLGDPRDASQTEPPLGPVAAEPEPGPFIDPTPVAEDPISADPVSGVPVVSAPSAPKMLRTTPDPFPWGQNPRLSTVDLEPTRIVGSVPAEERFVLQFSTGESVTVSGAGLVGRNPASQPGEVVDQLVTVFDAGKSVSKTHLEFGQEGGRFWVSDRYSTNGSTVRQPDAEPKRCEPGRRYFVARGTRVDIGEQFFVVS
jgi:predicted nucleic acid-binding Zn ribbon protein